MVQSTQDHQLEITDISQLQLTLNNQRVQFNKNPYT
ncbi:MAG: hypothetical protein ACJASH_002559, partial [Bermanella sp.]